MSEPKLELNEDEIEIIDFQSENQNNSKEKSVTRPIPTNVKYIMGAVVLIMIAGMSGLYAYSKKSTLNEFVSIDGRETGESSYTGKSIETLDERQLLAKESKPKKELTLGAITTQDKMNERVISMEAQIQQMAQQIEDLSLQGKAVRQLNTQAGVITQHIKTLPTQNDLTMMKQDFESMLQKKSDEIKNTLAKNYKKAKSYVSKKKYKSKIMPFKLVSIDQWNGVNYAAIQSKNIGAIENLRLGDTRSGWKVERIDMAESSVVFKNIKNNRSVKQTSI